MGVCNAQSLLPTGLYLESPWKQTVSTSIFPESFKEQRSTWNGAVAIHLEWVYENPSGMGGLKITQSVTGNFRQELVQSAGVPKEY